MSQTAVGLFDNAGVADDVLLDLDASDFPRKEIRILREPVDLPVTGIMSTPRTDFEVGLERELIAIGATIAQANAYAKGMRGGGVLVFATGSSDQVDTASDIMNRHGAIVVRELIGSGPGRSASVAGLAAPESGDDSSQTGRIRQTDGGARLFVW